MNAAESSCPFIIGMTHPLRHHTCRQDRRINNLIRKGVSMHTIVRKWGKWLMPAVLAHGAAVLAQDKVPGYPVRPIRLIIGVAPGAGADIIARMTAEILRESWGQNVVVDPRPGG